LCGADAAILMSICFGLNEICSLPRYTQNFPEFLRITLNAGELHKICLR